jgi:hypothetical protein
MPEIPDDPKEPFLWFYEEYKKLKTANSPPDCHPGHGRRLGISSPVSDTNPFPTSKNQGSEWTLGCRLFFVTKI